jgi:hypothetical protein
MVTKSASLYLHQLEHEAAEIGRSSTVPYVATKPTCRMCAISELPQYFVPGVENLSNSNGVKLISSVPGKCFLFEGLPQVNFGAGKEACRWLSTPRYTSRIGSLSKSDHYMYIGILRYPVH